ncbi:MAG: hypothetical protein WDA71_04755 [Actinomycetota bacterium]
MSRKQEDAEYYQARKGDTEEWGEPEGVAGKRPERRRLKAMVSIRLTPEEEGRIRGAAARQGLSVSAFIRQVALRETAPLATVSEMDERRSRSATTGGNAADVHLSRNVKATCTGDSFTTQQAVV